LRFFFQKPVRKSASQAVPGGGLKRSDLAARFERFFGAACRNARFAVRFRRTFFARIYFARVRALPEKFQAVGRARKAVGDAGDQRRCGGNRPGSEFLATSQHQSFLNLVRGKPGKLQPPRENMDDDLERAGKSSGRIAHRRLGCRRTWNDKSRFGAHFTATEADELMINAMIYDHAARLRSIRIMKSSPKLKNRVRRKPGRKFWR
jgi:hypothetical protein